MKEITATDAARGFSDMLDAVEHRHQSFVVMRGGRPVARVEPVPLADGATVKALLASYRPDGAWKRELTEMRSLLVVEDRSWPA